MRETVSMIISKATLLTCLASLFFLTACGGGAVVKNEATPEAKPVSQPKQMKTADLNEAQLKALLVGNTQIGQKDKKWTSTFNPNGVLTGTWGSESQTGTYSIKGNLLCRQWKTWAKGTASCWTVQKRANNYYATLQSGSSISYEFAMK